MEFLFATVSLLAVTVAASIIYYRRIKQAQGEYEGAKDLVKNITLGFTRQISRLTGTIEKVGEGAIAAQHAADKAQKTSSEALNTAREGLGETKRLTERIGKTDKVIESVKTDLLELAKGYRTTAAQSKVEGPIPLQQEAVLEQLTETEMEVLAIIEERGEGSVPQIRDRIKKTREHTARLLKKLYDRGFIDRNTSRMPYRYYIRKEIREIIQQQKKRLKISV